MQVPSLMENDFECLGKCCEAYLVTPVEAKTKNTVKQHVSFELKGLLEEFANQV